jgi:hypothetical protein
MARFETMDKVALVIATLLIVGGFFVLLIPQDFAFGRATNFPKNRQETLVEHVTLRQSGLRSVVYSRRSRFVRLCSLGITLIMKQRVSSNHAMERTADRCTIQF